MLESKIEQLIEAVKSLEATIKASGLKSAEAPAAKADKAEAPAAEEPKRGPGRPAKDKPAKIPSEDDVKAVATEYMAKHSKAAAAALIKETTGADKLAGVKPEQRADLIAAFKAGLEDEAPADEDDL